MMIQGRKVRVIVVDDSVVVRRMISDALNKDSEIEVVGTASDPYVARELILQHKPDVLTLDMDMPRMDGLTFLKILQAHHPIPVIVISSLTQQGSKLAVEAMEAGAVDVLAKPHSAYSIGDLADQLPLRVKGAALARTRRTTTPRPAAPVRPAAAAHSHYSSRQVVVVGASTGGTEAIREVFTSLPNGLPGICVVQHIPAQFSRAFAERLNGLCPFEVREAKDGDVVKPGLALIAPGDYHMALSWSGDHYRVSLRQGPPLHHVRPAVDVLFSTAADCGRSHVLGVLLTGMGRDGAVGMQKIRAAGGHTIAQNEETCVVYGMPRAAIELKAAASVLPLDHIPRAIQESCARNARREPGHTTSSGSAPTTMARAQG